MHRELQYRIIKQIYVEIFLWNFFFICSLIYEGVTKRISVGKFLCGTMACAKTSETLLVFSLRKPNLKIRVECAYCGSYNVV